MRHPDYRLFIRVHNSYCEGRIPGRGVGGSSEGRPSDDYEDEILNEIEEDSTRSVRQIERRTGIPKSNVHFVLKKYLLHPFHVKRVQTLQTSDYARRVEFCRTMLRRMRQDPNFFNQILWSDESSCRKDGYLNLHNLHSWEIENPHLMRPDRSQTQFKINYWTGIINGQVIGPYELPRTLNADIYLDFLQNHLSGLLEDVPLSIRRHMWLQNDGCPAHYAQRVREYLNQSFPQRWIGRLGPILWPARSPDLNPLDFFYWGTLKDIVYQKPVSNQEELRERVSAAAQQISSAGYARRIKRSFIKRCRACIRAGGRQFEHLLK